LIVPQGNRAPSALGFRAPASPPDRAVAKHKRPNWPYSAPIRTGRNKRQVKRAFIVYGTMFDTRQVPGR